jgi:hypothetical protein
VWHNIWTIISGYGDDEVTLLAKHFGSLLRKGGCDPDVIWPEWITLKNYVYTRFVINYISEQN